MHECLLPGRWLTDHDQWLTNEWLAVGRMLIDMWLLIRKTELPFEQ